MRVLEGAFVNTKGGNGKNKEAILVQEHAIRNQKDIIRGLSANKTETATRRASGSANIIYKIGDNEDKLLNIPKPTTSHTKKTSSKDLDLAISILRKVDPFNYVKGRKFDSFKFFRDLLWRPMPGAKTFKNFGIILSNLFIHYDAGKTMGNIEKKLTAKHSKLTEELKTER
ncbi:unnamed protein product [Mytilus coruscus]|uniref:Uncharacterized protein n=1 Tax=Mytilus coruscus TaxID=42192 RepID=A0A6J8CCU9_MYTCO|nr:unnamed protein product [Mytilus coruscus]